MVRGSRGGYTRLMLRTLLTCFVLLTAAPAMAQGPVVFAASSLKTALDDVAVV
ncbi:MAG: ABC-type molybdate transport system substrate-binding protein, partial [Dinoroseobacter sp.]